VLPAMTSNVPLARPAPAGKMRCPARRALPTLAVRAAETAARLMPSDEEKGNRAMRTHTAAALVPQTRYDVIPVSRTAR
ncbi:hypothetical protein PL81_37840, partial [Streptomyces sp. RSD-27]